MDYSLDLYTYRVSCMQLNAEVEFLVKTSELLVLKGIPTKEKNDRVGELLVVHQRVRDKIREYETVLSMTLKFHQLYQELDSLLRAEPVKGFSDPNQARMQLSQHQERQNHIRHLYKLAISLGADISSTVQQSQVLVFSVQDKMERLRRGSVSWAAQASQCEESLMSNMHYCIFKEEISEFACLSSGLPVCPSVRLSVLPSACLSSRLPVCPPVRLFVLRSACLSSSPPVSPPVRLSLLQSACLCSSPPVCPPVCLSVLPSACLSSSPPVSPPVRLSLLQSACLSSRLPVCPPVRLSVLPSACLSSRPPVCPPVCLSVLPSACLSSHLPVCPPVRLSVLRSACLSLSPPVCPSVRLSVPQSACLSLSPPVCPPVRLSVPQSACLSLSPPACPPLKESFKDLKKKFNNLKFNYMKKNEKMRNLKAVKNQIQQIEIYTEKLQVLKKKLQAFAMKLSSSSEKHLIGSSPRELEDAVNELQRQVGDFDRTVEEYKQNLDLSVKLQQAMEEYQFWCDEASSTIVRVGKYSSQCKTKEAISTLYKQFEKFVWPTIPQQEERISQITELAVRLHGAEEGKKYVEKTVTKHTEIVESIKELSSGLLDLEAKLQAESLKPKPSEENKPYDTIETPEAKETGHTPEITGPDGTKEEPVTKKPESKKPQLPKSRSQELPDKQQKVLSETRSYTQEAYSKISTKQTTTTKSTVERKEQTHTSFSHTHTFSVSSSPVEKDRKIYSLQQTKRPSQDTPPPQWPLFSTIHREDKQASALGTHHDKIQVITLVNPPWYIHPRRSAGSGPPQDHHRAAQQSPVGRVLWAESCGQSPVGRVLWAESCGRSPVGGVLWAESCGLESCGLESRGLSPMGLSPVGLSPMGLSPVGLSPVGLSPVGLSPVGLSPVGLSPVGLSPVGLSPVGLSPVLTNEGLEDQHCTTEAPHPAEEDLFSQSMPDLGVPLDGDFQHDHLTEESFSNDEYECTSPDDISLPPLSETPESNMVLSENDLDLDGFCMSSHSTHLNQFSQHGASSQTESYPSPTAGLVGRFRAESSSFVHSPLSVPTPTIVSSTISSILKSGKPGNLTECHQTVYSLHESRTETQECVHEPAPARNAHARASNMHAPPKPLLTSEQEPELCGPTAVREEIRRVSGARAVGNLATVHGPNFSKHLSNATVMEGSPVTLEVEVTGFPEPALTWFKNGQKVTNDERVSLSHKEGKHALFIERAEERDSGQYVVSASNSAGTVSSSSLLHVKGNSCHDLDALKLDWQTCFGTLCVLLWLLYLLVL
ncbi:hypothetical protein NFI96_032851 [Prochilodus magdalenae]|nr:hypothetical protein NFI96_032851 [Prochilodus magdalenae]